MHSGLLVERDLVRERKDFGQQYNTCAPEQCQDHWKGGARRTRHATFGKQKSQNLSHSGKRASEGQRHWTHKHLVTYRTYTYPQLSVSLTEAKGTKRQGVTANPRGQESVNRLSQFMLCTQAIYIFFFTRRAINIAVLTIIIIIIIHAQLIHTHSRQNNTARTHTHTRSAQAYKHTSHCTMGWNF